MIQKQKIYILGIESSCDETAAAVVQVDQTGMNILSSVVASQATIHSQYGGVVPEVAARNHIKNIIPVIDDALVKAKIKPAQIDKIAVTVGPGLITSLMVGAQTAKTLSLTWSKPLVPVNHLHGHLYAPWLEHRTIDFPVLALIVSGGHTELVLLENATTIKKIGQTIDDAAGEAFDKVAKMLGLGYPGGPEISKLAEKGDAAAFDLPRPMLRANNFDFSFSGLKTAVLYRYKDRKPSAKLKADLAASFQTAVVDVLTQKTIRAAKQYNAKTILLSGGVAANLALRDSLTKQAKQNGFGFVVPAFKLCTDNAAMIAAAGYFTKPINADKIKVDPNLPIA